MDLDNYSKKDIINIFNSEIIVFITELLKIFKYYESNADTITELQYYKNLIETGISVNIESGVEMFSSYLLMEGNEDFLDKIKNKDYDYFYKMQIQDNNNFSDIIKIIKKISLKLNEENKSNIFGYLENLSILSNIYVIKKMG
jgi:hypothetical protein